MNRFSKILCVVDPGGKCETILKRAATLAESNQATLSVVTVLPPIESAPGLRLGTRSAREEATGLVEAYARRLEEAVSPFRGNLAPRTRVLSGIPFIEVVREVLRGGHELVIKAPEDPGWLDHLLGSDDMHLLRKCPCPVWLIKCEAARPFRRILAAVDVDESYPAEELALRRALNRQVLEMATSLALAEFAELHVVHAWEAVGESALRAAFLKLPEPEVERYVDDVRLAHANNLAALMREVAEKVGREALEYLKPQTHLLKGWARREIPAFAGKLGIDLIVMGTVARTGISGFFMGNTAETILGQLGCSVLAVKPPGFRTPVTIDD